MGNKSHFEGFLFSGLCKHGGVSPFKFLMKTELSTGHSRQLPVLAQSRRPSARAHGWKWQSASEYALASEHTDVLPSEGTLLA